MILRDIFKKQINEGGNLASHTAAGTPTVGWTGIPGNYSAEKIDTKNRAVMRPKVKQLLVDINNLFTRQYGRPIWSAELIEQEVEIFISGSSKWFMKLRQPNPKFNPQLPVSDANPKEIGVTDKDFQRVKKKLGDIDTQVDRRIEPQIEEFLHKNIGANIGSAVFLGTKKGSDQWLALWKLHEPPITLQVDLEFSDYTTDERGFEVPTEWAQVSHGSAWEDLEVGMKGVFRQWLYRSLAKVAPTDKYIAKLSGAGKKRGVRLFGGDDGKEPVVDLDNPPPPFHDANFSFAVASVGGGGVRAKYRQPTPEENVPLEINGVPVMVPLEPKDSEYIKDMSQQFEQFFGVPADGNQTKMMASFVGSVELMKQYFTPEQHQIVVNEFLKINFGKGAQMIDADDPTSDFKTKMVAIDYLLDQTGMRNMRKQVLQMAKDYESAFNDKQPPKPLAEAEVKAQLRKGMPHLRDLKAPDFLDLLDEISDGNGRFKLQNIPLNVKVDGFGGRFGKNSDGKPFMGTSRTEPRYQAGFLAYHKQKGTTDTDVLGRAQLFDQLFNEMMNAVQLVDSKLGPDFLVNKQVTCEVLYLPFATETPEGKLKFVGIQYDKLPEGVQLALVPFRVTDADTGEDLEDSNKFIKQLLSVGSSGSVMFIDNSLTQKEGLDVTEIINPLDNIEQLKQIVSDTSGKRDRISQQLKREVEEKLQPIKLSLEKAIIEDPNIIGKDILGQDYEGIVINSRLGPIKVTSAEQKQVIADKNAAKSAARAEQPRGESKTAVVAIGSFVGHKGHQDLFKYTIDKAKELGGDPYLFIGNAEGKDDPIPPAVKVQTWHKLYPEYANNISTVQVGGQLIQKVKHELINPLPGKPPRYDNVVIMVGEDRAGLTMPAALMKAVNKFPGYEHVKVSLEITPRESGFSGTALRNSLKNDSPEQALAVWSKAFDVEKLGKDWILHLMDITKKGMGIAQQPAVEPAPVVAERLSTALIRPRTNEATFKKSPYGRTAASQQRAKELLNPPKPPEPKKDEKDVEESRKKKSRSKNKLSKYFFPGYGYYGYGGSDDSGEGGGDGGGEGMSEGLTDDPRFQRAMKKIADTTPRAVVQYPADLIPPNTSPDERERLSTPIRRPSAKVFQGMLNDFLDMRRNGVDTEEALDRIRSDLEESDYEWTDNEIASILGDLNANDISDDEKGVAEGSSKECPPATQDITLNLKNRQQAINEYGYGPLNPDLPNTKFWMKKVDEWNLDSLEEAKQSLCGNCAAFDQRKDTLDCIAQGIDSDSPNDAEGVIDAGDLGYCKFLKFKCASKRTCDAWVTGGPLTDNQGVEEGLGSKLARLGLAGAMALGAGGANARVTPGQDNPNINRLTGKPNVTQVSPGDNKPAVAAPTGFSKEWLQKAADPNRTGRYMISVEKAQELLSKMNAVDEAKKKGADGKACWKGYRYNGTENGKDKCVPVSEDVENIMDALINKIIVNEAVSNNRK